MRVESHSNLDSQLSTLDTPQPWNIQKTTSDSVSVARFAFASVFAARPSGRGLSVVRSHKHISVQIIDDLTGKTLAAASSQDKKLSGKLKSGGNQDAAQAVGKAIAERAIAAGIKAVCFDRGPYRYHGRVAALANAAREGGLSF